jgi:hypothetical protein
MENMNSLLFKLGVATWCTDIITIVPIPNTNIIYIGKTLPTDVGFIYGIATYVDGTKDADGNTPPTTLQAQNIFVTLQTGSTQFISQVKLSDFANELLNVAANSLQVRDSIFRPVIIPAFDLSKSYFQNPAGLVSTSLITVAIRLKLWYIQHDDWEVVKKVMKHPEGANKHFQHKK